MDRKWMTEETSIMNTKLLLHELVYKKCLYIYSLKFFTHVLEFMLWLVDVYLWHKLRWLGSIESFKVEHE
jgi:hypothetical protein